MKTSKGRKREQNRNKELGQQRENSSHTSNNQKKAIIISDKVDLGTRKVIRDKEGYYIMIKWPIL